MEATRIDIWKVSKIGKSNDLTVSHSIWAGQYHDITFWTSPKPSNRLWPGWLCSLLVPKEDNNYGDKGS